MALIKCTECGQMVSDKAVSCPNCGAPIERKVKCEDCGCEMPADAAACPNCGCPNSQRETAAKADTQQAASKSQPATDVPEDANKRIQRFLVTNRKYLPQYQFESIRRMLAGLSEEQWDSVEYIEFKDPLLVIVVSVLVGYLGVDRFILGDITNGLLKLVLTLLCGIGLIWWVIDFFSVSQRTRECNLRLLKDTLSYV